MKRVLSISTLPFFHILMGVVFSNCAGSNLELYSVAVTRVFVATSSVGNVSYSTDGAQTWTTTNQGGPEWITYAEGTFVASSQTGTGYYASTGLGDFQTTTIPNVLAYAVCWGNGRFLSPGFFGWSSYSDDGITWTQANSGFSTLVACTYGNNRFVVVGSASTGGYSANGTSFTAANHNNGDMNGVIYGENRFVAVGNSGKASYSDTGTAWTNADHNNGDMKAVAYGNGRFVAVGSSGVASYSDDGVTWTTSNHGNGDMRAVTFGYDRFVAVGVNKVSYSLDGINWVTSSGVGGTGIAFAEFAQ